MKRQVLSVLLLFVAFTLTWGQRQMENLDRGLVAVNVSGGVYLSWRITGQEWYDVTYNVYRNGTRLNDEPLEVSNYFDAGGSSSASYTVRAVVRGAEQSDSKAVAPGKEYLDIPMQDIYINGRKANHLYELNDATAADLDGDGEYEIIVKRVNKDFSVKNDSAFALFQAYKLDGTCLWTINCGPNLLSSGHVETNIAAYDWSGNGRAELVMRAADGTIDGKGNIIGDGSKNYRNHVNQSDNMQYMTVGAEYLIIMDGLTGELIDQDEFIPRTHGGYSVEQIWGDGYGHRANKFFFGAPYLNGRTPSIYIGRGIYTRTVMRAYDFINGKLVRRWAEDFDTGSQGKGLNNLTKWGAYWGQGFHNFTIADVDGDGRDEIVHGSMVVDEYGQGLYSTGYGHGDAMHVGNFDPYRKGIEIFTCLEDAPHWGAAFRDAATGETFIKYVHGRDCGRAGAGNVTDDFLGAALWAGGNMWSATTREKVGTSGGADNFMIYWDGDLLQETFNYTNVNDVDANGYGTPSIYKYGKGTTKIFSGTATTNHTKGNPCLQADLFGDWREELVLRSTDNMSLRIYTTTDVTTYRNYTLMHDMQYRQAICWQMCGYNQPPHVSYFLGEAEGILLPPPPVMNNDRVEITSSITTANNDKHLLLANTSGGTVSVASGASPYIVTINSPKDYTLTGTFGGEMRLIKQGAGALTYSGNHTYTGVTELWDGVTTFEGVLESPVAMKRFAELNTAATYNKGISMEYGSILRVAGNDKKGVVTASLMQLDWGAVVELDMYSADLTADKLMVSGELNLADGCIIRFAQHNNTGETVPAAGEYLIAEASSFNGNLSKVVIEGLLGVSCSLKEEAGKIYLVVNAIRAATDVTWDGTDNAIWDLNTTKNFTLNDETVEFVTGDRVTFDETSAAKKIEISGEVVPSAALFTGNDGYTIQGEGRISGNASLIKEGNGTLKVSNRNDYTGKTILSGGTTSVSALATSQETGALGALSTNASNFIIENGAVLSTSGEVTQESAMTLGEGGGVFYVTDKLHQKGALAGGVLTKKGSGTLYMYAANTHKKTILDQGTIQVMDEPGVVNGYLGDTIVINGGTVQCLDDWYSYSNAHWNIVVPKGKTGTINLDGRCNYKGSLTGEGTLNVYIPYVRTYLQGNWSKFAGTVKATQGSSGDFTFDNNYGMPLATLEVTGGTTVRNNTGGSFKIGAAAGTGTLGGSGTWIIGNDTKNSSFSGTIASSLEKMGTKTLTLSGKNTFSGSTEVKEGTLMVNNRNATSSATGTGALTVYDGATLTGQGYIGNSRVVIDGTFAPGYYYTGNLTVASNVNLNEGGVIEFQLNKDEDNTKINNAKVLLLKGTLRVLLRNNYVPGLGDSFSLWNCTNINKNYMPVLELPELPNGLAWDTTGLLTNTGTLMVTDVNGLHLQSWDEIVHATVITLNGIAVESFECAYSEIEDYLNETNLERGMYIVHMKSERGSGAKKILKK